MFTGGADIRVNESSVWLDAPVVCAVWRTNMSTRLCLHGSSKNDLTQICMASDVSIRTNVADISTQTCSNSK